MLLNPQSVIKQDGGQVSDGKPLTSCGSANIVGTESNGNHVNGTVFAHSALAHSQTEALLDAPIYEALKVVNQSIESKFEPIAICGMACRLPGGITCPQELWDFLLSKGDARGLVPESRYNISGYHSASQKPDSTITEHGYFLDKSVDLGALDTSFYPMARAEVERLDPQQRMLLEVSRECLDDAGEVGWKGKDVAVYIGSYGNDWHDTLNKDSQQYGTYHVVTSHDFALSNRLSYELDLRGPSMTIRTACSSGLVGLNEACAAIAKGDCVSAIVGGVNLITAPGLATIMSQLAAVSADGSCKTFSSTANGYARGEAVVALYVKSLSCALRDGNPVRAVIVGSATNCDGRTPNFSVPSSSAQESLIRHTYRTAGISDHDVGKTGFFECHGTGTSIGDPLEANAVARIFKETGGIHVGSVKPNVGHGEGASGLTSVLKSVLALEHGIIPPNIKCLPLNPKIPFADGQLTVPTEATQWPVGRHKRVSVNSFGIGGSNAHVIIDSVADANPVQAKLSGELAFNTPHLLMFSANSPQSLKEMTKRYTSYFEIMADNLKLSDLAFTLAYRREHLRHRSFVICSRDHFGTISTPAMSGKPSSIVMVFTGQGAQWPQMGRELLKSNSTFRQTVESLDGFLQDISDDAPIWTIEEELLKPARTSRVNEAEFSQPICTALQIALVDTLKVAGIKPSAVIGHSSGEIAAAYAAGSLGAREAILVAYYRGLVAKRQTRVGSMAAVSLGWNDMAEYLIPGVVVACDNSPSNVTLSGDSSQLKDVLSAIKQARPGVSTSILKVEKAYHSHHMTEVGEDYYQKMRNYGITGKEPEVPFFSTVTGEMIKNGETSGIELGARYWQRNLESPVLFRSAMHHILSNPEYSNSILLEIGPHSALAAPLRQILTNISSGATYIPTITRRKNSVESFLSVAGKLWAMKQKIDLQGIIPSGRCLPDLPRYPWNHSQSYWHETRVSKEWRQRKFPYHSLLGAKVPESSSIDPIWRNIFHLENASWIRDHKIEADIIFPFAGYVAMAAEAIRQITDIQETVEFRNVIVNTALLLPEDTPIELGTACRRTRLTDSLEAEWWEFTISSHNGREWTKHCSGEVRAHSITDLGPSQLPTVVGLPRRVNLRKWYDRVHRAGLHYGYHFTTLEDMMTSTCGKGFATAKTRNNWHGDEEEYHLHPIVIDTYFQLLSGAAQYALTHSYRQVIPVKVGHLRYSRCSANQLDLFASSNLLGEHILGDGSCTANSRTIMAVSGVRLAPLRTNLEAVGEQSTPSTARSEWVPHIDFANLETLLKPGQDQKIYGPALDLLAQSAIAYSQQSLSSLQGVTQQPHLQRYKSWLDQQCSVPARGLETSVLASRIDSLSTLLARSPAAHAATAIVKICSNITSIVSGEVGALDVLSAEDVLEKLKAFMNSHIESGFFRSVAYSKPNLCVLELGAGLGNATKSILGELTRSDGQVLYSSYVCTDPSSVMVASAKEYVGSVLNLSYASLNIQDNPTDQGFNAQQFDLVIANDVLHMTSNLRQSLKHVHTLLKPGGRLFMQQPHAGSLWTKFVLGMLPGWWCGIEDGRLHEPYVNCETWSKLLDAVGFDALDTTKPEKSDDFSNITIVATPRSEKTIAKTVTVLCTSEQILVNCPLLSQLEAHNYEVSYRTMADISAINEDVISLLDWEQPFFDNMESSSFQTLKTLITHLADSGLNLFWVTRSSQIRCSDPRYAPVIGLGRTMRTEMAMNFVTCEIDDMENPTDLGRVIEIFTKFRQKRTDTAVDPDFEYSIVDGLVRVNRFFPYSIDDKIRFSEPSDRAALRIGQLGRLDSLYWATQPMAVLGGDEVEIETHAAGLNFRDILLGMGIIEHPELEVKFGCEGAGVIRRVGPAVKKFCVGDRVTFLCFTALSTTATILEQLCEQLPDGVSFLQGATMSLNYATAIYALVDIGRLEQSQSVLIHSACGGVGLAAVQIARAVGAEIYATVSSEEKSRFLTQTFGIPEHRIFHSRDMSFVEGLKRETDGRGVDVALNSLSGALLHATWRCIAEWGIMVEIGKRDLLGAGKLDMDVFLANRTYSCVDLVKIVHLKPQVIDRLLRTMMTHYRQGHIRPIQLAKVVDPPKIHEAFRYMQQGNHIGKIVLSLRNASGQLDLGRVADATKSMLVLDSEASYLLVGGLGGLGRTVAIWMIEHGARHLTFLSRGAGSSTDDTDFAHEVESLGCSVQLVRGSVTDITDVARAVDGTPAPLKGIIQMSMVLRDQAFPNMTFDDWCGAMEPKLKGTWLLHEVTCARGLDLSFFVLFSSLSGVMGQPGQANYAAANTFLDAFSLYRTSMMLPCSTIDIGAIEGAGYLFDKKDLLKKMQGIGWRSVKEEELLKALAAAILPRPQEELHRSENLPSIVVDNTRIMLGISPTIPLSNPESSARLRKDVRMAVYHNVGATGYRMTGDKNDTLRTFLASAQTNPSIFKAPETPAILATEIVKKLFSLLLMPEQEIDVRLSLEELGLDSLLAVEMRAWWKLVFGLDISVLEMLSVGTVQDLGRKAADQLAAMHGVQG